MTKSFPIISIIGLGQIGGSLALALAESGECDSVQGYDIDPIFAEHIASQSERISAKESLADAVQNADLIVLAVPVSRYAEVVKAIAPHVKEGAKITDVGSVKGAALDEVLPNLPKGVAYVPSHPIAGSEKSGASVARADLFEKRLFLVTPPPGLSESHYTPVAELWRSIGAEIVMMPAEVHDQIYAYTSHVPHLCSFAACHMLAQHKGVSAPAEAQPELFGRFIRIGRSEPQMWRDVFLANKENMLTALEQLLYLLNTMVAELNSEEAQGDDAAEKDLLADPLLLEKILFPKIAASVMVTAASLCEQQIKHDVRRYTGAGFHDFCAPMIQDPEQGDLEKISTHAPAVAKLVASFTRELEAVKARIEADDRTGLLTLLQHMSDSGKRLIETVH